MLQQERLEMGAASTSWPTQFPYRVNGHLKFWKDRSLISDPWSAVSILALCKVVSVVQAAGMQEQYRSQVVLFFLTKGAESTVAQQLLVRAAILRSMQTRYRSVELP